MTDVFSEIRSKAETGEDIVYSLIEDTHDVHMDVNGWEFTRAENKKDIEGKWVRCKDVEKQFSPLMAHLQNYPELVNYKTNIIWKIALEEWKEELDRRIKNPENYMCVPLEELKERYRKLCKTRITDISADAQAFFIEELTGLESKELLQPSTTSKET